MIEITDGVYTICFNCIDVINFKYRFNTEKNDYRILIDFGQSNDILIFKDEKQYKKAVNDLKKGLKELWNN